MTAVAGGNLWSPAPQPNDDDDDEYVHNEFPSQQHKLLLYIFTVSSELLSHYTVRPLFKKFTQPCESYEPTNWCV